MTKNRAHPQKKTRNATSAIEVEAYKRFWLSVQPVPVDHPLLTCTQDFVLCGGSLGGRVANSCFLPDLEGAVASHLFGVASCGVGQWWGTHVQVVCRVVVCVQWLGLKWSNHACMLEYVRKPHAGQATHHSDVWPCHVITSVTSKMPYERCTGYPW